MRKRIAIIFAVALALGIAMALLLLNSSTTPMPVYQGRTAQQWLFSDGPMAALSAFKAMGTNAGSFLMNTFRRRDSTWDKFYFNIYPKLPRVCREHMTPPMRAVDRRNAAEFVLLFAGIRNQQTLNDLKDILADKTSQAHQNALSVALNWITPRDADWVPALICCLEETNWITQMKAARVLAAMGNAAAAAIPTLNTNLYNANDDVRLYSAEALWQISDQTNSAAILVELMTKGQTSGQRDEAVHFLCEKGFPDPSLIPYYESIIRRATAEWELRKPVMALAKLGPLASNSAPVLVQKLDGSNFYMRKTILRALAEIDPATSAKYDTQ